MCTSFFIVFRTSNVKYPYGREVDIWSFKSFIFSFEFCYTVLLTYVVFG